MEALPGGRLIKDKRLFRGSRLFPADLTSFDTGKEAGVSVTVRIPPKMVDAIGQMVQHFQGYSDGPKTTSHFVRNAIVMYWRELNDAGLLNDHVDCELLRNMRAEFESNRTASSWQKRKDSINETMRNLKAIVAECVANGQWQTAKDEAERILANFNQEYQTSEMYRLVVGHLYNDFNFQRDLDLLAHRGYGIKLPPRDPTLTVLEGTGG
jgi:hypothetical protein